jgi:CheY-like chemotaxis protein
MSRIESGRMHIEVTECSLPEILNQNKTVMMGIADEKKLVVTLDTSRVHDTTVLGDQMKLNKIIQNLLGNAIKFSKPGGDVSVCLIQNKQIRSGYATYELRVKDCGIGMSKEFLEHIFEPFSRERTSTVSGLQGTGLGLSITRSLVDMMGGSIEVYSEENVGTEIVVKVELELPGQVHQEKQDDVRDDIREDVERLKGKQLLLVDDNELNREIAVELLEENGFVVDTANDGAAAVEKVKHSKPGEIYAVLMDIQMPVMDGYEAARTIRGLDDETLSAIPIVAMTANVFEEDRRRAVESGMNGYVPKPIDVQKMLETLCVLS